MKYFLFIILISLAHACEACEFSNSLLLSYETSEYAIANTTHTTSDYSCGGGYSSNIILFEYTVSRGVVPILIEIKNTPNAVMGLKYKDLDANRNCNVEKMTYEWGATGIVRTAVNNVIVGSWSAYITPTNFTLTISYNNNLSLVDNMTNLQFLPNNAFPLRDTYCAPYFFQLVKLSSALPTLNISLDNFRIRSSRDNYCGVLSSISGVPRISNVTSFVTLLKTIPTYVNYTTSIVDGAFYFNASATKENTIGVKIININGFTILDSKLGSYTKQFMTYQPVDKLVFYFIMNGALAFRDDLNQTCFLNWLDNRTVKIKFNFYDADTLDTLNDVNLNLSRDYIFDGVVSSGQNFTIATNSVVGYTATKSGYSNVSGTFIADRDKNIDVLLRKQISCELPQSKYIVITDKNNAKIGEPIVVKVRNTEKAWWNPSEPEWIDGAEIYVNCNSTSVKTSKPVDESWWIFSWLKNWLFGEVPFAVIRINSSGEYRVSARIGDEFSKATLVTIANEIYTKEGTLSGEFPKTDPDRNLCYYKLLYTPQSLKIGGTVTFKTVKECGTQISPVNGMIYLNGAFIGEARPELTYKFVEPGVYRVKAIIGGQETGEGIITVFADREEFRKDNGLISLIIRVYAEDTGLPLSGILVQRISGSGSVLEQRWTNASGITILNPEIGKNYSILVSDPSNRYISEMRIGSWSSNTTLVFYLDPVNEETRNAIKITHIQVRVNSIPEDNIKLPPGKHRISVVDQDGGELSDVEIYINGQKVGKTGGWGWIFGAGLEYNFEPGNYEIVAIAPSGLTDTIYVIITNNVSSYMLIAYPGKKGLLGIEFSSSAAINIVQAIKDVPLRFEVREVAIDKPMQDWTAVANALIYINGTQVGVTKSIGGLFGIGAVNAYEHIFTEAGNYTVYATIGDARTQTMIVLVSESEDEEAFGGILGGFFGKLAEIIPITGIKAVDMIIWVLIVILLILLVIGIIRVIL